MKTEPIHPKQNALAAYLWPLFLLLSIAWSEMTLRLFLDAHFLGFGIFYMGVFTTSIAFLVSFVFSFFKPRIRHRATVILLVVNLILYASELVYFKIFYTFYGFYSLVRGGQVLEFGKEIGEIMLANVIPLLILAVPLILYLTYLRKPLAEIEFTKPIRIRFAVVAIAIHLLALGLLQINKDLVNSPHSVYYEQNSPIEGMNKLGLLTQMRRDFIKTATNREAEVDLPDEEPSEPWLDAIPTQTPTPVPTVAPTAKPEPTPIPSPTPTPEKVTVYDSQKWNVLPIDFDSLIAHETDEQVLDLHQYLGSRPATNKNDHTGMFEGYNLIFVTAESFSSMSVDPELTPTLYKMQEEGMKFTEFYNPIWGVSTLDGEYVNLQGLLPKSGVWSMLDSADNYLPFTLGNQFKKLGAVTNAWHNHTYTYYNRDESHPNLGYNFTGLGNGLEITETWPESDVEMVEATVNSFLNEDYFHTYYLTVSGHMNYSFEGNAMAEKHEAEVADLELTEGAKAYLATQIELDQAMELLLEKLDEAGVAEKTLIVLAPDHYPYGLARDDWDSLAGEKVDRVFEIYHSSLLVYAKGMQAEVVTKPMSSLDILPTVSNLMGLPYDSRLLMGKDIFSDNLPLVIFNSRNFITSLGKYDAAERLFYANEGAAIPDGYQEFISEQIEFMFEASESMLETNYYYQIPSLRPIPPARPPEVDNEAE